MGGLDSSRRKVHLPGSDDAGVLSSTWRHGNVGLRKHAWAVVRRSCAARPESAAFRVGQPLAPRPDGASTPPRRRVYTEDSVRLAAASGGAIPMGDAPAHSRSLVSDQRIAYWAEERPLPFLMDSFGFIGRAMIPGLGLYLLPAGAIINIGFFIVVIMALRGAWRSLLALRRQSKGLCVCCGYALRPNVSARCSECGHAVASRPASI